MKKDIHDAAVGGFYDQAKSPFEICRDTGNGYQLLSYKYETEDGYINTVFRVMSLKEAKQTYLKTMGGLIKRNADAIVSGQDPESTEAAP